MRKKRKSCCLPGNLGWNFRTSFWPRFRPRFGTAWKTRNFFCDKGQKFVAPSASWLPERQSKKLPEIYVEILEMIYEKFFVINHGHRHDPHTNRPGLPGFLAVVVVGLRRSCPTKMASVWNLVWKVYWLINVSYQCIANNFCLLIEYPSFFKSTLPYLSEFPGLSLPSLWNISHVAWPYVSLHSPILCHDISHYTIIVSHRSALFRIVFSITAQLDRALAGMTTTGGYRNCICLALPYVIWYCFSGPIYEIWACLSLLFEHTYLSSILSYINLFHLIRPIPIASCTNIPVAVGLLLVGWPPSHTGE